jgi:hypothetical protein
VFNIEVTTGCKFIAQGVEESLEGGFFKIVSGRTVDCGYREGVREGHNFD